MSESQNARFEPKLVASGNVRKYSARNEYMKAYQKRKYETNQEFRVGMKDRMNKRNFLKRLLVVLVKKLEAGPDIICLCGKRKNSKIKIYF